MDAIEVTEEHIVLSIADPITGQTVRVFFSHEQARELCATIDAGLVSA